MRISQIKFVCVITFLSFAFGALAQESKLKLADPLTSNMVIQQNQAFTVWGIAKPNTAVKIEADWAAPVQVMSNSKGEFEGIIPVPAIEKGDYTKHRLTISSGEEQTTLSNLLIGELWICSGQSNMQFSLKEIVNAEEELPKTHNENLRLFNTALNFSNTPINTVKGEWRISTPETAKDFSAVGYFFGKKIQQKLDVPIGLVFTGIGASAAQAYVPKEVLAQDALLDSIYLQPYLQSEKSKEKIDAGFSFEKVTRPYLLYNAMIHPFKNLSIKGVIWYQGEANRDDREEYTHLMYKMIESWRKAFSQGNFPFYYVQIAPYDYDKKAPEHTEDAYFREAQENISKLNNTEMVSTVDVGNPKDLHPKNKKPIGIRLAKTALHKTYNFLDENYLGPTLDYVEYKKGKAIVHYVPGSVSKGLQTNDGKAPQFFQLAGKDGKFYWAEAKIKGKTIEISSKEVKHPTAVRYAFTNFPVTNLENGEQLPALQFRTDGFMEENKPTKDE